MKTLMLAFAFAAVPALAVYEVGDTVDNLCWKDVGAKEVCLNDHSEKVRVLIYNAGWCGPCNEEFAELSPELSRYEGKAVTFFSLSSAGWQHGSAPTQTFLKAWKEKFDLNIVVAASPGDAGRKFMKPPVYIPNAAIVGKDGKLAFKGNTSASEILKKVDDLLEAK